MGQLSRPIELSGAENYVGLMNYARIGLAHVQVEYRLQSHSNINITNNSHDKAYTLASKKIRHIPHRVSACF